MQGCRETGLGGLPPNLFKSFLKALTVFARKIVAHGIVRHAQDSTD